MDGHHADFRIYDRLRCAVVDVSGEEKKKGKNLCDRDVEGEMWERSRESERERERERERETLTDKQPDTQTHAHTPRSLSSLVLCHGD